MPLSFPFQIVQQRGAICGSCMGNMMAGERKMPLREGKLSLLYLVVF